MGIYLNPANKGFAIAKNSKIYVDKTQLIQFTNSVLSTEQRFICVSRPRRFGKSITAQMLSAYYEKDHDSRNLFQGLRIETCDTFEDHLNQYHVLFFEMQRFLHRAQSPSALVSYLQKMVLKEIKEIYASCLDPDETDLIIALETISEKTGQEFIFIIDEWDCIFREARYDKTAQKHYLDFLRDLLKGQAYVKLAYMTGILPVKKYGTHSALNMFCEYSMTAPGDLAPFTGFTESEVCHLCQIHGMDFSEMQKWYDGYKCKNLSHVYNPKSVVDAMLNKDYRSYWSGTETYEALKIYIDLNFDGLKDAVIAMLANTRCRINTGKFQNDMTTFKSKDDVLTLLVHLGYLAYDESSEEVYIPNMEIAEEFKNAIEDGSWTTIAAVLKESDDLLTAALCGDTRKVAAGTDAAHMENTSILSYHNENSLSCVIAIAFFSARRHYLLYREFPTGKGFADMVFLPRPSSDKPAMIVELKWDLSAYGAIRQIREKNYVKALEHYHGNIQLVSISYDKKTKHHTCCIETFCKTTDS